MGTLLVLESPLRGSGSFSSSSSSSSSRNERYSSVGDWLHNACTNDTLTAFSIKPSLFFCGRGTQTQGRGRGGSSESLLSRVAVPTGFTQTAFATLGGKGTHRKCQIINGGRKSRPALGPWTTGGRAASAGFHQQRQGKWVHGGNCCLNQISAALQVDRISVGCIALLMAKRVLENTRTSTAGTPHLNTTAPRKMSLFVLPLFRFKLPKHVDMAMAPFRMSCVWNGAFPPFNLEYSKRLEMVCEREEPCGRAWLNSLS